MLIPRGRVGIFQVRRAIRIEGPISQCGEALPPLCAVKVELFSRIRLLYP